MSDSPRQIDRPYRIILLDSDEEGGEVYKKLLENRGAEVDIYKDPEEALEAESRYDAAISDFFPNENLNGNQLLNSIDANNKILYTAFDKDCVEEVSSEIKYVRKGELDDLVEEALPQDFRYWISPADWISHDLRNHVGIVQGLETEEREGEIENPGRYFKNSYQRFEEELQDKEEFNDRLIEDMRQRISELTNEEAENYARFALKEIKAVRAFFESNGEMDKISDIFQMVEPHGNVEYIGNVGDEEVKSYFGSVVGTKVCDFLKHAKEEDSEAEMFAEITEEDEIIKAYIGDTGPGLEKEDLESRGLGSEIIEHVAALDDARFASYLGDKIDEIEFKGEKPEDIGALFELRIEK